MLYILISPFAKIIGVIALVGVLFGSGYYKGYSSEKERFDAFKADLEAQVKAQEAINEATKKQQDIIAKSIRSDYENKLNTLKSYYGGVRQQSNSANLSSISNSPFILDGKTTDSILVEQCTTTTLQVNMWQEWVTEVSKTGR